MKFPLRFFLIFLSIGAILTAQPSAKPGSAEALEKSALVFRGAVTRLQAATLAEVAVSENTVVARVDEVMRAPQSLGNLTGREITVYVQNPAGIRVGEQLVFFANPWMLGDGVAVQEVGRQSAGGNTAALRAQLTSSSPSARELSERISSADMVIAGKVAAVREGQPGRLSEHDPQWREATVEVTEFVKGASTQKTVVVRFPGSQDVAFYNAPRFAVNQEGVWILRKWENTDSYTAIAPSDFQTKEQLNRIKALFTSPGAAPAKKQR